MEQSIVISFEVAGFLGGIVALVASVVVWAVRGRLTQVERAVAEQAERTDRAIADLKDQMVHAVADLKDQMFRAVADLKDQIKQCDDRIKQCDERGEERGRAASAHSEKRDALHEGRYREIQAALREISYRVGRLEGAGGAPGGPAPRSGRHSPRQADEPQAALGSEPDPALVAERDDGSMVLVAGGRAEPTRAAGQAYQAVPGPEQPGQEGDETEREPGAEEPLDTAR